MKGLREHRRRSFIIIRGTDYQGRQEKYAYLFILCISLFILNHLLSCIPPWKYMNSYSELAQDPFEILIWSSFYCFPNDSLTWCLADVRYSITSDFCWTEKHFLWLINSYLIWALLLKGNKGKTPTSWDVNFILVI